MYTQIEPMDLVKAIGAAAKGIKMPEPSKIALKERNIQIEKMNMPFYIAPKLEVGAARSNTQYCCLVSAPAAVGKSTLAKYLLNNLVDQDRQVLYIPLKDEAIGDNYFSGLLSNIYPDTTLNEILKLISSGNIILVFDGYDEVSMTKNQIDMNVKFINEIQKKMSVFSRFDCLPVIFLFRSVFYEFGIFENINEFSYKVRLNFFSEEKRAKFLNEYLVFKYNRRNYESHVDRLLSAFQTRLNIASKEAEAFFGHAIVLQAFGDYIECQEESNFLKIVNRITTDGLDEAVSVGILENIVASIVEREIQKFSQASFTKLEPGFVPYTKNVQTKLLISLAYDIASSNSNYSNLNEAINVVAIEELEQSSIYITLPEAQKAEILGKYAEELRNKIEHHPFVDLKVNKNIVFRNPIYYEYYLAMYFVSHIEVDMCSVFDTYKNPSYFFAMFFICNIGTRDVSKYKDALYFLMSLYLSAAGENEKSFKIKRHEGRWEVSFETDNVKMQSFYYSDEILIINIPSGGNLQNFEIDGANGSVSISGPIGEPYDKFFSITDAKIDCATLEISGTNVKFDQVFINAIDLEFSQALARIEGLDSVFIQNSKCKVTMSDRLKRSNWSELDFASDDVLISEQELIKKLKKIFLYFRKHGRSDFGCYEKKYGSRVLNKGRDEKLVKLTEFLMKERILEVRDHLYILNQEKLKQYGINYIKQNEIEVSSSQQRNIYNDWVNYLKE